MGTFHSCWGVVEILTAPYGCCCVVHDRPTDHRPGMCEPVQRHILPRARFWGSCLHIQYHVFLHQSCRDCVRLAVHRRDPRRPVLLFGSLFMAFLLLLLGGMGTLKSYTEAQKRLLVACVMLFGFLQPILGTGVSEPDWRISITPAGRLRYAHSSLAPTLSFPRQQPFASKKRLTFSPASFPC